MKRLLSFLNIFSSHTIAVSKVYSTSLDHQLGRSICILLPSYFHTRQRSKGGFLHLEQLLRELPRLSASCCGNLRRSCPSHLPFLSVCKHAWLVALRCYKKFIFDTRCLPDPLSDMQNLFLCSRAVVLYISLKRCPHSDGTLVPEISFHKSAFPPNEAAHSLIWLGSLVRTHLVSIPLLMKHWWHLNP